MQRAVLLLATTVWPLAISGPAIAGWDPPGIVPSKAVLADVLAAHARSDGSADSAFARRHERWTYVADRQSIAVSVAVRDDDFHTSLAVGGLTYAAGRNGGVRWRADGNGISHDVPGDLQGDPLDIAPQAVFPLEAATCTLAGEAKMPAPAWVLETHRANDKEAYLYVDEATGAIVREIVHDGRRIAFTDFDRFEALPDGALRSRHWIVKGAGSQVEVTVDAIEPGPVAAAELERPQRRLFSPGAPEQSVDLKASFEHEKATLEVDVDGKRRAFLLDTGTSGIIVNRHIMDSGETLGHTTFARIGAGPFALERASALSVPFWADGILGLDFFAGHVVEIDYPHERVRVLSDADARAVFGDPSTTVLRAGVEQGIPLVHAAVGDAQSDAFLVDTGSYDVLLTRRFMTRYMNDVKAHWESVGWPREKAYLEGSLEYQLYKVPRLDFGDGSAPGYVVSAQLPSRSTDDLSFAFDGIVGTDVLSTFDMYFDYDNGRIGLRR